MRTKLFIAIRKTGQELINEHPAVLAQYLNVSAVQQDINWYKVNTDEFEVETLFKMHRCTLEDFGTDDMAKNFFDSWTGYVIMCPELISSNGKELILNGAKGMMKTSSLTFKVD